MGFGCNIDYKLSAGNLKSRLRMITLYDLAKKTHGLVIDSIYIKELTVKTNPTTQEIVEAIKKEGVFQQQQTAAPKQQYQPSQQLNLAPPLPRRSLIPEENAVNF